MSNVKDRLGATANSYVSKKLAALGAGGLFGDNVIASLKDLGVSPDFALGAVLVAGCVYLIVQGFVDYRKEGVKGLLERLKLEAEFLKAKDVKAPQA